MTAVGGKPGHFYKVTMSDSMFLMGNENANGIHVWYYNRRVEFFFDKYLYDNTEIEEVFDIDIEIMRAAIKEILTVDENGQTYMADKF